MKKNKIIFCFLSLSLFSFHLNAQITILASDFNATYSNTNPLIVTQDTTIILNENIIFSGQSEVIKAGGTFGQTQENKLVFEAENGNSVIVDQNSIWSLSTFNSQSHIIQFTGNAVLEQKGNATIYLNGAKFILDESSRWIPQFPVL